MSRLVTSLASNRPNRGLMKRRSCSQMRRSGWCCHRCRCCAWNFPCSTLFFGNSDVDLLSKRFATRSNRLAADGDRAVGAY